VQRLLKALRRKAVEQLIAATTTAAEVRKSDAMELAIHQRTRKRGSSNIPP